MTFADFAVGEARFRKHFRVAPADSWNADMLPVAEFVELPDSDREGKYPFIWAVNKKNRLVRALLSEELVRSVEERLDFWRTLKGLAGLTSKVDAEQIANEVRAETAQTLAKNLLSMLSGGAGSLEALAEPPAPAPPAESVSTTEVDVIANGYDPVWIDQGECTACDECMGINPQIFQYDAGKRAYVKNPKGGPFKDIVRAAEKCTASCIHPGTPADPNEKGLEKLVQRAEKYQ